MNSKKNETFLKLVDSETKNQILKSISTHYGCSKEEALEEVTSDEAEHLLDYLTGNIRTATYVLMQKYKLV